MVWRRKVKHLHDADSFSEAQRQRILPTCNEPEFAALPSVQILTIKFLLSTYLCSEPSSFQVLQADARINQICRAFPLQVAIPIQPLRFMGPQQVWILEIRIYRLACAACGFLSLVIDFWTRKMLAWEVDEREDLPMAVEW